MFGNNNLIQSGLTGILGGIFGNSGNPASKYGDQIKKYFDQARNIQNPFYQMGTGAIPQYQDYLSKMSDPSQFINNITGQYKQSPYYDFLNQQGQRGITNEASASGLIGSTPYQQAGIDFSQMNANKGLEEWLSHVLGINTEYGQGLNNELGIGQNSANSLTNLLSNQGKEMGSSAYNKAQGQGFDWANAIGGIGSIASLFL